MKPTMDARTKARILIADDNAPIRGIIARLLSGDEGSFDIVTAGDGEETLAAAERERPDLILLDRNMPGAEGWSVLRALRAADATQSVPIIVMSGQGGLDQRLDGFESGADDFVAKPFCFPELKARVARLLRRAAPAAR